MLKYDPQQRPTCSQILQYPYFQSCTSLPPPSDSSTNSAAGANANSSSNNKPTDIQRVNLPNISPQHISPQHASLPPNGVNQPSNTYLRKPMEYVQATDPRMDEIKRQKEVCCLIYVYLHI